MQTGSPYRPSSVRPDGRPPSPRGRHPSEGSVHFYIVRPYTPLSHGQRPMTAPPTRREPFLSRSSSVVFYCPSIAGQAGEACLAPTMPRRGLFLNSQTGSADPRTDRSSPRSLLRLRSRRRPIQRGFPLRGRCRSPPECPPHRRRTRFCIFPSGSGW